MSALLKPIEVSNVADVDSWKAELSLGFSYKKNKTVLSERKSLGPLVVQRPFYPEEDVCHVYMLHPPGGIVGGDILNIDVRVEETAHALVTTPGAGKLYRSPMLFSQQINHLSVQEATLEWFPQETIVFNGAHATTSTKIDLSLNSKFIGWEIICLGRPACQEIFEEGEIKFNLELYQNSKPILLERLFVEGNDQLLEAEWGFRKFTCVATFIATGVDAQLVETVKEKLPNSTEYLVAVTIIENVLVCRFLGHQAEDAKKVFIQIWSIVRKPIAGKTVCEPRIWKT